MPAPLPPFFIPDTGTYPFPVTVEIFAHDRVSGVTMRWTIDGSDPTGPDQSPPNHGNLIMGFFDSVTLTIPGATLKAIAIVGGVSSAIKSAVYSGETLILQPPTITPVGGAYPTYPLQVTCTAVDGLRGETMLYTLDGTDPSLGPPVNGTPIPAETGTVVIPLPDTTLKVISVFGTQVSGITTGLYTLQQIIQPPPPPPIVGGFGGLQFKDVAPMICGVVDNGVCADDPRVLVRLNEATKIILDTLIPVGGMITAKVALSIPTNGEGDLLKLPPQFENIIEAYPADPSVTVRGDLDIAQGWYEIMNDSVYLDPTQHHDNPLIDLGLVADGRDPSILRRTYKYPGISTPGAVIVCTGAKRFVPLTSDEDYLIVQNVEAIKCVILSIERYENNDPDGAVKYRKSGIDLLEAEVKKHIMDPRNYMRRKSNYQDDTVNFAENTLGWVRGNIALDIDQALKTGKIDLTWSINQVERRLMKPKIWKDCIVELQANVVGGFIYFPIYVQSVLAANIDGSPIPIRGQFFEHLDNGPGMFACSQLLKDMGDEYFPASATTRRKYKVVADCSNSSCINAICKVRWVIKKPNDMMTIKNYEAIRLAMTAKFLEEKEDWQNAQVNWQQAFQELDNELKDYLAGIRHTVHIQTTGFGLGDVGAWGM